MPADSNEPRMPAAEALVAKMRQDLNAWTADLDAMESRLDDLSEPAWTRFHAHLDRLRTLHTQGWGHIATVELADESSWPDIADRVMLDWETLTREVETVRDEAALEAANHGGGAA